MNGEHIFLLLLLAVIGSLLLNLFVLESNMLSLSDILGHLVIIIVTILFKTP